jgi:hypothetical protein
MLRLLESTLLQSCEVDTNQGTLRETLGFRRSTVTTSRPR